MKLKSVIINHLCQAIALGAIVLLVSCSRNVSQSIHLKYGNPTQANNRLDNYLIERPEYVLSYNCTAGIANWASWQLNRSWLGKVDRANDFRPDTDLPSECYAVRPNDYRHSDYDRGHLVPSGDRTRLQEDNSATFIMSNIIPQSPANNREVWRELEEYSRDLAYQGKELYIVAGGREIAQKIAQEKVTVPKYTWKAILVLDRPGVTINPENARTIAVWIPNNEQVANTNWQDYMVSVQELETKTGYNFFDRLASKVQQQLEK